METEAQIIEKLKSNKHPLAGIVQGAFGDMEDCEAILEPPLILPAEGGTFMKFYGCSYLFKGFPVDEIVQGFSLAKSLISFLPREIIMKSHSLRASLIYLFIFRKRRFYFYCNLYFGMIYDRAVARINMPEIRYNKFANELRRAVKLAIDKEFPVQHDKPLEDYRAHETWDRPELALPVLFSKILNFVLLFLEIDNAYRFRLQDALEATLKYWDRKSAISAIKLLCNTLIEREMPITGLKGKFAAIKKMLLAVLYISPMYRRLLKTFFTELNIEKIKLDEDDWYFCLRRCGYNFRGKSLDARLAEKEIIDKEKGHVRVRFQQSPK